MAVVKKEPIAGIYARVSTKDQSCAAQLNELRLWAERSGVTVFGEYVDHKQSGRKASRPEFDRLMADARAKRFNIILVYKLDRFGRSVLHLTRNLKELDELGVRFIATSQGLDIDGKNSVGKLVLHILAAVAEFESDIIGERVSFGLAKRRRAGHRLGREPKAVDIEQARRLRAEGLSLSQIGNQLGVNKVTIHRRLKASQAQATPAEVKIA